MLGSRSILFIFFLQTCLVVGCAKPYYKPTRLDYLFKENFEGFEASEIAEIKEKGKREKKGFPYKTFDEIWDTAICVLMQEGIVVRASKDTGVIVTITNPPLAILIERGDIITVFLVWNEGLNDPRALPIKLPPDVKENMAEFFFGKLANQLYADEKWKWLKRD